MAPVIGGIFVLYSTGSGEVLWAKTLLVNGLIWGGVFLVVTVIRALMRSRGSSSSASAPRPKASGSAPATIEPEGLRLKTSASLADGGGVPDEPAVVRSIAPVGRAPDGPGTPSAAEPPKLRMSMGRQTAGPSVPVVAIRSRPCAVCGTMGPASSAACTVCGRAMAG
ncbi:MAG: hypothetical protein JWO77_3534 [Ilumatobacteraceae bacterium]|nr:hypothetical protein [Ilumatobacteraceae bacterium]